MAVNVNPSDSEVDRKNADWRIRVHRQVDALCDDVESRKGFTGRVLLEIFWIARKFQRFETTIKQSVAE